MISQTQFTRSFGVGQQPHPVRRPQTASKQSKRTIRTPAVGGNPRKQRARILWSTSAKQSLQQRLQHQVHVSASAANAAGGAESSGSGPRGDSPGSSESIPAAPRYVFFRLSAFYWFYFLLVGIRTPFFPLWLGTEKGLSSEAIGLVLSATQCSRLLSGPVFGAIADAIRSPRLVAIVLAAIATMAFVAQEYAPTIPALVLIGMVANSAMSGVLPLGETSAIAALRGQNAGYGRARLWGSLGFITANLLAGRLVGSFGASVVISALSVCALFVVIAVCALPRGQVPARDAVAGSAADVSGEESSDGMPDSSSSGTSEKAPVPNRRKVWREGRALLTHPVFVLFVISASLLQASHAVYYSFSTISLKQAGYSASAIGALWATGVLAEVALFASPIETRLRPTMLLMLAGLAAVTRWVGMSFVPPFPVLLLLQCLHAFTFGACHLGTMHFIAAAAPPALQATAQGWYSTTADGVVMGLCTLAAGVIYHRYHSAAFGVMALLAIVGLVLAWMVDKKWDGKQLDINRHNQ
ncbi:hypothetical protein CYMTET_23340 [Cymbomonas tetramitiformis]|uniref:Major facilitator superfamily associated domain-containing protein n=1 Tax=Cymbomonas tetramitiformis TaxID=36881 RepID=A0AAE0FYF2_9CHLO|nr:hypothetical protein CYMTET_23340 [Cymbomonas tetramitiformis]